MRTPKNEQSPQSPESGKKKLSPKALPDLLIRYTDIIRDYDWGIVVNESVVPERGGSFDEEDLYRGKVTVAFQKAGKRVVLAEYLSTTTLGYNPFSSDDPNDIFTNRYSYTINLEALIDTAKHAAKRIKYQEIGGNPDGRVWPITAEALYKHYLRFFGPKMLIDGWGKNFDLSRRGESTELSPQEVANTQRALRILSHAIIEVRNSKSGLEPVSVMAGNSAGVMRLVAEELETADCSLLFSLPQGKDPNKYLRPSTTLFVPAPPQPGRESAWGDELVGKTGLASLDFGVRTVFLIGGGANLEQQLPIYLDNALEAVNQNKMYVIAAVQGVGGLSEWDRLIPALKKYAAQEKYKPLFFQPWMREFPPRWLQLLDPSDEKEFRFQVDTLIFRTQNA